VPGEGDGRREAALRSPPPDEDGKTEKVVDGVVYGEEKLVELAGCWLFAGWC
jgi:hypothetical protein